ncbi:hypothetical protein NDI76_13555 [Halogeometricum sp. S1BR25-6]|uniref:GIY-YIG domain-containing protein n=1 Tax=Halogeometricum salsisoli TaxID=2950536 RepID=A0ABU2GG34_9EURY|nr:hypothetical protein [Halogeometricum sp. S1BR25-6]MDS0299770.1 hypothetical protein [Halogeometricum sp. S1BR25-6]
MTKDRRADLDRLYALLARLDERVGGARRLGDCTGRMDWPARGVYLFLAPGETRAGSGARRVTRVGTHAVSAGSSTTMWDRVKQHYGTGARSSAHPHGGNHRGSVYRRRVGEAFVERYALHDRYPDWGTPRIPEGRERSDVRDEEYPLERRVSAFLRDQPFLWVDVDDEPGPDSDRAYLERNLIALLSNYSSVRKSSLTDRTTSCGRVSNRLRTPLYDRSPIDPRRSDWLGDYARSAKIRTSGLWNVEHVEESYDPTFLDAFEAAVERTGPV